MIRKTTVPPRPTIPMRHFASAFIAGFLVAGWGLHTAAIAGDSTHVDAIKLSAIGAVTAGTVAAVTIYQRNAWWQGDREPFRFENDWEYALNIDKLGHIYGAYSESKIARAILSWSGLSDKASLFFGSLVGLSYQMYIEMQDGFHKDYGFSPGDGISNIIGASFPLLQETYPVLKNFSMKYSYFPSRQYLNDLKTQTDRVFTDDYEGTIFWITMDPHFLLSNEFSRNVPDWLGVSFGLAAHDLNETGQGKRLYYLTVDYQFSRIKTESSFLQTFFGALDFFHLPAPGFALEDGKFKVGIFYTYHVKVTL